MIYFRILKIAVEILALQATEGHLSFLPPQDANVDNNNTAANVFMIFIE
jgi:hypothetical protein